MYILPSAVIVHMVFLWEPEPCPLHTDLYMFFQVKASRAFTKQANLDLRHGDMIHPQC